MATSRDHTNPRGDRRRRRIGARGADGPLHPPGDATHGKHVGHERAFEALVVHRHGQDLSANATAFAQLANWLQGGGSKCPSPLDTSREVDGPGARAVLKIHSKRLNETVLNWNVVVKTLTGTEFERFLHDDA